jgi:concanavalin A-like lectin/glucanase superfamily protein
MAEFSQNTNNLGFTDATNLPLIESLGGILNGADLSGAGVEIVPAVAGTRPNPVRLTLSAAAGPAPTVRMDSVSAGLYRSTILSLSGLVAYWRLGEAAGTVMEDDGPNNLDGTYSGGFTLGQPSLVVVDPNTSVDFDGLTGLSTVLQAVLSPFISFTQAFSIGLRCNNAMAGFGPMVSKGTGTGFQGFALWQWGTGQANFEFGTTENLIGGPAINDGANHSVVATFDGADKRLYVDGALVAGPVAAITVEFADTDLLIAQRVNDAANIYDGLLDEIFIVGGRAITAAEVANLHAVASSVAASTAVVMPGITIVNPATLPLDGLGGLMDGNLKLVADNNTPVSAIFNGFRQPNPEAL